MRFIFAALILATGLITNSGLAQTNMSIHYQHECDEEHCQFKVFDYNTEVETVTLLDITALDGLYELLKSTKDTSEYVTYRIEQKHMLDDNGNSVVKRIIVFYGFNPNSGFFDNQIALTIYTDCGERLLDVYSGYDRSCYHNDNML